MTKPKGPRMINVKWRVGKKIPKRAGRPPVYAWSHVDCSICGAKLRRRLKDGVLSCRKGCKVGRSKPHQGGRQTP